MFRNKRKLNMKFGAEIRKCICFFPNSDQFCQCRSAVPPDNEAKARNHVQFWQSSRTRIPCQFYRDCDENKLFHDDVTVCSIFITMVKVRPFCWRSCVCCCIVLFNCMYSLFYEPSMTTTKLPLVG